MTRSSIYCHWILVKGNSILWPWSTRVKYYPVPAGLLLEEVLTMMVMVGQAVPLPDDLSQIVGCIQRGFDNNMDEYWKKKAMKVVVQMVDFEAAVPTKALFWDVIEMKCKDLIDHAGGLHWNSIDGLQIIAKVKAHYSNCYNSCQSFGYLFSATIWKTKQEIQNYMSTFAGMAVAVPDSPQSS